MMMVTVFIISAALLFLIFLILGVTSQIKHTWHAVLYYSIAAVSLVSLVLLIADPNTFRQSLKRTASSHSGYGQIGNIIKVLPEQIPAPADVPPEPNKPEPSHIENNSDKKIDVPVDKVIEYAVVKGDGLWSIASRAGVKADNLKIWNGLESDDIFIGQILKIYGKDIAPLPPSPKPEIPVDASPSTLISHGSLAKKQIALTFDAGSDAAGISILEVLNKHNVKATFFLTGKWVEAFPEYAKRIIHDGHSIGNHTYSHPDAVKVDNEIFKADIARAEKAIIAGTGVSPRPYFRFPYGAYNESALKAAGEAGYPLSFQWSIDTIDWKQPSADEIVAKIKSGASNGDIILMHIGGINTPKAVDTVIPFLKGEGYTLVTLDEMME